MLAKSKERAHITSVFLLHYYYSPLREQGTKNKYLLERQTHRPFPLHRSLAGGSHKINKTGDTWPRFVSIFNEIPPNLLSHTLHTSPAQWNYISSAV